MLSSTSLPDTTSSLATPNSNEEYNLSSQSLENSTSTTDEIKRQGKWSPQEDALLKKYVDEFGERQWQKISKNIPGRTSIQCLHRWSKILKPGLVKGPWTAEEDLKLMAWVQKNGATQWTKAGEVIQGRSGKQCRERWFNSLNPDVKKGGWTAEEDRLIFEQYQKNGSSWSKIARLLPGRSENSVKNRFYSTLRKTGAGGKPEPALIDCKRVKTDETAGKSTQVDEFDGNDANSDSEKQSKKKNELYNLLKRSYSDPKELGVEKVLEKKFSLTKPKEAPGNKEEKKVMGKPALKSELEKIAEEKTDAKSDEGLNLMKRYSSCKVTANELDEFEKVQKKIFGFNNGGLYRANAMNLASQGSLFGQGLGFGLENLFGANRLFKPQENMSDLLAQNNMMLGLNPLALNLQSNALLGGNSIDNNLDLTKALLAGNLTGLNGMQGVGSLPLNPRNVNIGELDTKITELDKLNVKEEHDYADLKAINNNSNDLQKLLSAQKVPNNIENLMAINSLLYNSQLQSLLNSGYGGLAGRGLNNMDPSLMMRNLNPLEAAISNGKSAFQPFSFPAFQ